MEQRAQSLAHCVRLPGQSSGSVRPFGSNTPYPIPPSRYPSPYPSPYPSFASLISGETKGRDTTTPGKALHPLCAATNLILSNTSGLSLRLPTGICSKTGCSFLIKTFIHFLHWFVCNLFQHTVRTSQCWSLEKVEQARQKIQRR